MMVPFVESMFNMLDSARAGGLRADWLLRWNESLVQRARNGMAAHFLWETDYERLMFIDSDIEFSPEDVAKLWNLDKDVAVGIYAMKKPGKDVYAGWKNGELTDIRELDDIEVLDYAGTGFMMIKRGVLEDFCEKWPERTHQEEKVDGISFTWFDPRINQDEGWYMPEDYAFCHDFRRLGGEIYCDTSIRLKHYGLYPYGGGDDNSKD